MEEDKSTEYRRSVMNAVGSDIMPGSALEGQAEAVIVIATETEGDALEAGKSVQCMLLFLYELIFAKGLVSDSFY